MVRGQLVQLEFNAKWSIFLVMESCTGLWKSEGLNLKHVFKYFLFIIFINFLKYALIIEMHVKLVFTIVK